MGKIIAVVDGEFEDEGLQFEAIKVHNKIEISIKNNYNEELYLTLCENEIIPVINALKMCLEHIENSK